LYPEQNNGSGVFFGNLFFFVLFVFFVVQTAVFRPLPWHLKALKGSTLMNEKENSNYY
jgi:hypothetical protein